MSSPIDRRQFISRSAQAGAVAGLGELAFVHRLPPLAAADIQMGGPAMVRLSPEIEPIVRIVEQTERNRLLEVVAERIRSGTSYQELLAALMLAGVRGIKPRPVGFQFHAVLVINSAHLATLASSDKDRWLPLFWALDNFKQSQATNKARNAGWMMPALDDAKLPAGAEARQRFVEAMDDWNEEAADRAAASLARNAGIGDVFELLWRYGARDFRDIGHKAIYVANAYRTLQTIGYQHAEP